MLPFILGFFFFYYYVSANRFKVRNKIDILFNFKRNFNKRSSDFIGDLNSFFYKIRFELKKCEFGLFGVKESGEKFVFDVDTMRFLFNTNSIYLLFRNIKLNDLLIKNVIFGNFKLGYGQGLVFNYLYDKLLKPLDPINAFREQKGIKKCKSVKKNSFFGICIEVEYKSIESCIFFSKDYFDAFIYDNYIITARRRSRYCTLGSLARKNVVNNTSYGFVLLFKFENNFNFGFTFINSEFNRSFNLFNNSSIVDSKLADMKNLFSGNKNINFGVFSDFSFYKFKTYFEFAVSTNELNRDFNNYGYGLIFGTRVNIVNYFKYVILFRIYSENYHNFYGKGFGTGKGLVYSRFKGAINNEIGVYNALKINFPCGLVSNFSIDLAYIPSKTFIFSRALLKYFTFELIYAFRNFDYIKVQCKYMNSKKLIISKTLEYSKEFTDNCRVKTTIKKRIKRVLSKTDLFISMNHNEVCQKMFSCGIIEDLNIKINDALFFRLYIMLFKISDKTPIYVFKNKNNTKKSLNIDKNLLSFGISTYIKIYKKFHIDILYKFKYATANRKKDNTLSLSLKYLS